MEQVLKYIRTTGFRNAFETTKFSYNMYRTSYIPGESVMLPIHLTTILKCLMLFIRLVAGVSFTHKDDPTMSSIPPQLGNPPKIHILKILRCDNLIRLVANSFITYPNLERLFLEDNEYLKIIEEGAFNGLFLLERLKFTGSQIIQLPEVLLPQPSMERVFVLGFGDAFGAPPPQLQYPYFRGFTALKDLDLTKAAQKVFNGEILPSHLKKMYLSISGLTEMPNFSRYTPNITLISMPGNPLENIPEERITGLDKLSSLKLSYCSLTSINVPSLVSLTTLDLEHNQLRSITGLSNLPKLRILKVKNNNLTSLPDVFHLPDLGTLNVADNPWECGRDLCWLWALLFRNPGVIHTDYQLICASPPGLAERNFLSLREEDLGCQVSNFGKCHIFLGPILVHPVNSMKQETGRRTALSSLMKMSAVAWKVVNASSDEWPLLLTWFNFNPSMDK